MEWEKFKNPPIIEALLDIRVNLPAPSDLANLEKIEGIVKHNFPTKEKIHEWRAGFGIKKGVPEPKGTSVAQIGYQFKSADNRKVFQARLNGFTFNLLKPYESWDKLRDEAVTLWEIYLSVTKPQNVTRVALRYINRIELPLPIENLKEYMTTVPEIAPEVPQMPSNYFMRLVIPDVESHVTAIITEAMEPIVPQSAVNPIVLDIDVFEEKLIDPGSSEIIEILEKLRQFKNKIFFSSLTSKTKELFK